MSARESTIALEDIAKKLGIAVSTVSRALRDMPGIHPGTREEVLREAKSLGYIAPKKRGAKRGEASSQALVPHNILILTLGGSVPSDYLSGMSRASLLLNFSLLSYSFAPEERYKILDAAHQPPALRMGAVAGIVLIHKWPDEVVQALSQKCPTTSLVVQYPGLRVDLVGIDHVNGIFSLVRHFKEAGHKRIGFFGLNPDASWSTSRFAAYVEALTTLRMPVSCEDAIPISDVETMPRFPLEDKAAIDLVIQKINSGIRAWICADDAVGYSLCAGLTERGIRIPKDVSVTGFHQLEYPVPHLPRLTTMKVNDELLGATALRRLSHRLSHPKEAPRTVLIPCEFLQGETTQRA